ncbi:EamA family transporter [Burkholderia sp. Bp8963]|uniref:DMT family transporter n=1 Tax=Burkholderia sp. Bp8963 TaxID=2184547 RepID=UPI000F592DDA|nr:DMT family transporter [Burkholderia sp. Bp8963]RQS65693.1 EamA family transporter [Burkholderia sp. Bp8963]
MNNAHNQTLSVARYWKGIAYCVGATILMGGMFPIMTDALLHVDPFTFTSLRYLIAGVGFLVLLWLTEGSSGFLPAGESFLLAWFLGSVGFCGFGSFVFLGQQLAGDQGALTASIMMATQPMMGLLLNALVKRTAPAPFSILFVILSFAGVSLVITRGDLITALHEPQHYAANALIVLGALCWVIYTFGAAHFTRWSALKYTTITTWLALTTIVTVNLLLIASHAIAAPSLASLRSILPHLAYMGPVAGFGAILCWITGNRILGPMNGVLFMDIVPITAFIVSAMTGVVPNHAQIAGAALTGAALILNNLYLRQRGKRIAKAARTASSASA